MQCPHDDAVLVMTERKGVEIDYCPQCRGVWLDRGELDKIIDRSMEAEIAAEAGAPTMPYAPRLDDRPVPDRRTADRRPDDRRRDDRGFDPRYDERRRDDRPYDPRRDEYRRRKKKESWLGDLFDF
ncbi:zf-TFIIB domain-containing protein [Isoptericola sp. NEAU-Y5]|uniref:Zf-TFIIB domain-containing protein n=1 Tax=Isoptericola luteus TaxID=2879484 RepID=A0ABS7ZFA7_9MICO|nr:zf-TFIIB domain-containing protein [Isoptericola sp. NEAU-Y5]MCA5892460.1 zf-TFIIB domain-containing protein [Isoptericola sp. NEAU-Y5]